MTVMDTMHATHDCGFSGTLRAVSLHDCDIQANGGRCEDFPCCGHTDGDGCQTLPSHTSAFYLDNPHLLHVPLSPEWFDAIDDDSDEPEYWCQGCGTEYPDNTEVFDNGDRFDDTCVGCRVRWYIEGVDTRAHRQHYTNRHAA